jgi:hypothetical protein
MGFRLLPCEWRSEEAKNHRTHSNGGRLPPPLASPVHGRRAVEVPPRNWSACKPPEPSQTLLLSPNNRLTSGFWYSQGVGKTTLVMRVFETLRGSHPNLTIRGFYTRTALPRPLELRFIPLCNWRPRILPVSVCYLCLQERWERAEKG